MHFSPARNWMNDPNGLVHVDGEYHLFFQHNPLGPDWGNMSWGHATSSDLLHWREHPVAIPCTPEEQIYSGSVVIDRLNSSGFAVADREVATGAAPPRLLVAIYTSVAASGRQAQSLAFSIDGGTVWEKYAGNPVLDRGSREFRDPKVFAYTPHGGGPTRWIMVAVEAVDRQVLVHSSHDLRNWTFESALGPLGPEGVVWECPDLFPLTVDGDPGRQKWVLLLSTNRLDDATGEAVDSSMTYLIGEFDGHSFVPDDEDAWPSLDHGRDFYAAVTFHDAPDDRRIALAWSGNWQYAAQTPTAPWRGVMSLPRELGLVQTASGLKLRQTLPRETLGLVADRTDRHVRPLIPGRPAHLTCGRHVVLEVDWEPEPGSSLELALLMNARLRYDSSSGMLSLERSDVSPSVHPGFPAVGRAAVDLHDGRLALLIVVDGCTVEVFAGDGIAVLTDLVFAPPGPGADVIRVSTDGGTGWVTASAIPAPGVRGRA